MFDFVVIYLAINVSVSGPVFWQSTDALTEALQSAGNNIPRVVFASWMKVSPKPDLIHYKHLFSCLIVYQMSLFSSSFRPSYRSRTVTLSCSGPHWRSEPGRPAATEEMFSWSRRNNGLWPCRERNWPVSTSCSLSTGRSNNAGRRRERGTASNLRPLRLGFDKGRRNAGDWRWTALSYLRTIKLI